MKKYIDAQLQFVRISGNNIIATSSLNISSTAAEAGTYGEAADRFRDFDEY